MKHFLEWIVVICKKLIFPTHKINDMITFNFIVMIHVLQ